MQHHSESESVGSYLGCNSFGFSLHSSYYNNFFLLRTPITIDGRPTDIKLIKGEPMLIVSKSPKSVKLSTISLKCMDPVLLKHGVYHIYTFYYALVPLYSISFYSNTSLKRFLTETEEVKRELASAIARACAYTNTSKKPTKNEYQDNSMEHIAVNVDLEVYLVSPTTPTEVHHVTLSNYLFIAQKWKNSWQFNFSSSMFINGATTNGDEAELADLQVELKGVVAWFELGVQLKIPVSDLLTIHKDHVSVESCRLEMLIRWGQLQKPTWTQLVTALVKIGRRVLAEDLVKKYGLSCELQCHAVKSSANEILTSEKELSLKTKELERARQSQNVVSRKLEKEMEDEVPLLQQKVNSLMMEMKILRKQLKHRNEELELFEEFQPSISQSQLNVLDRLMLQKNEEIKTLQNKLEVKEMEIAIARKMLQEKEKELVKLMEELNAKSARVLLLEEEVEQLRYSFSEKQEEMNRKVIEASTSSVSYENFIIDLQSQRDSAITEASKQIECHGRDLALKEEQISQLSERITEQEKEMTKLQNELISHEQISEQLSAYALIDDERAHQLLPLIVSIIQLKLKTTKLEMEKCHVRMELLRAQKALSQHTFVPCDITLNWSLATSTPHKIERTVDAVVNHDVLYVRPRFSQSILAYNSTNDSWSQLPECPAKYSCIAMVNGFLTAIGGELHGEHTKNLFSLHVTGEDNGKWVTIFPPMLTMNKSKMAVCNGDVLIVAGSAASLGTIFEVMSTTSLTWSTAVNLPYFYWLHSLIVCGGYLYCIYGDSVMFRCSMTDLIRSTCSKETGIWVELTENTDFDIPSESTYITLNGQLISVGGRDFQKPTTAIKMYCPSTHTWNVIGDMPTPRYRCFAAILPPNRLIVVGGCTTFHDNSLTDKVEIAELCN